MSEAATISAALAALQSGRDVFDWVLLDLMLPDGCGIQVIDALKLAGATTRICVVTGCGWELIKAARRAGADCTFTKPLCVEELIARLAPAEVM